MNTFEKVITGLREEHQKLLSNAEKTFIKSKLQKNFKDAEHTQKEASKHLEDSKKVQKTINHVLSSMDNPWFIAPLVSDLEFQKIKQKVNDRIQKNELEVEILPTQALCECGAKNVKFKVVDKKGSVILKHYFDIPAGKEDTKKRLKRIFSFEKDIQTMLKGQVFFISVKKKTLGFFKYLMQLELQLNHFNLVNEISKSLKLKEDDNKTFELKLRVRQAFNQKEMEVHNMRTFKVTHLYVPFDTWQQDTPVF